MYTVTTSYSNTYGCNWDHDLGLSKGSACDGHVAKPTVNLWQAKSTMTL